MRHPTQDWIVYLFAGIAILCQYCDLVTITVLVYHGATIPVRFHRIIAPTVADCVCACIWLWQRRML